MNVFILDRSMEKSAQMLDDAHLKAQINEACQILMANLNHEYCPDAKIGHINHPVTKFYSDLKSAEELYSYLKILCHEYEFRFGKIHQNYIWVRGFRCFVFFDCTEISFSHSKTYVNGIMTNDIEAIRHYISTKPMKKQPTWTKREKPDWWEV